MKKKIYQVSVALTPSQVGRFNELLHLTKVLLTCGPKALSKEYQQFPKEFVENILEIKEIPDPLVGKQRQGALFESISPSGRDFNVLDVKNLLFELR